MITEKPSCVILTLVSDSPFSGSGPRIFLSVFEHSLVNHMHSGLTFNLVHKGFFVLFFETGSHYVAQAGLKLVTLLSRPPKCWNYRHESLFLA
jgi:hypothetical protein